MDRLSSLHVSLTITITSITVQAHNGDHHYHQSSSWSTKDHACIKSILLTSSPVRYSNPPSSSWRTSSTNWSVQTHRKRAIQGWERIPDAHKCTVHATAWASTIVLLLHANQVAKVYAAQANLCQAIKRRMAKVYNIYVYFFESFTQIRN